MRENYHPQNGHYLIDNGSYFSDSTRKGEQIICVKIWNPLIFYLSTYTLNLRWKLYMFLSYYQVEILSQYSVIFKERITRICMRIDNIVAKFWTLAQIEILICLYLKRWIPWKDQAWILGFLAQAFIKVTKETNTKTSYAP